MKKNLLISVIILAMLSVLFCMCKEDPVKPVDPVERDFPEVHDSLKTGLPVIFIYTEDAKPIESKETYLSSDVFIVDLENSSNNLAITGGIRGRGNDTWNLPKKPYRIKFDEKQSLFGLTEAKNWILLANYRDYTLMMNSIAFELGERFGVPFTHHSIPVEVILNDKHIGSYVLTEHKEVGKGRIDINKESGWLVEADDYWDEDPKFKSDFLELPLMISFPEDLPESGYDFVKNDINQLEAKLFEDDYPNNDFMYYIDVQSFIDFIMVNDIVQNGEILHPKSMYWHKQKAGVKISLGPLWDFDWAFGFKIETEQYFMSYDELIFADMPWVATPGTKLMSKLFESPEFRALYKRRWNENYSTILSMNDFIDAYAKKVEQSAELNAEIWGWKGNDPDYMTEIARMKQWWIDRVNFLNSNIQNY